MRFKRLEEHEVESRVVCDFCNSEIFDGGWTVDEVVLEAKIGDVYPEGDFRRGEAFDCCRGCWTSKVRPALQALGGVCHEYDWLDGRLGTMPLDTRSP